MKIKIITVVTVILLFVAMTVPVYADTTLPEPPSEAYQYWVYMIDEIEMIHFITATNPINVRDEEGRGLRVIGGKKYIYTNNQWELDANLQDVTIWKPRWIMVAANHDIAYEDGSGFFFLCPKVPPLYQTMKTTDFGTILRIFSAGLIPIVGLIVLAIALTKGWRFLRDQLTI